MLKMFLIWIFALALFSQNCNNTNVTTKLTFERPNETLPFILVTINGNPAMFLLDTGSGACIIDINQLTDYSLSTDSLPVGLFSGVGGYNSYYILRGLNSLKIDGVEFPVDFSTTNLFNVIASFRTNDQLNVLGILGADFINKYHGSLNFANNQLTLIKNR